MTHINRCRLILRIQTDYDKMFSVNITQELLYKVITVLWTANHSILIQYATLLHHPDTHNVYTFCWYVLFLLFLMYVIQCQLLKMLLIFHEFFPPKVNVSNHARLLHRNDIYLKRKF